MIGTLGTNALKAHWWAMLIRGIVAVLFGLLCFALTGAAIVVLIIWVGIFFIIDGIMMIVGAMHGSSQSHASHWLWQVLGGLIGIAAGIITFVYPGITAITLALVVGLWAIFTGVLELATAIRLRSALPNEWLWILNGILSILLGVFIFAFPGAGLVALVWMIGIYAVLAGVAMIALSFRLRSAA